MADTLLDASVGRSTAIPARIHSQAGLSISEQMTNLLDMAKLTTGPQHLARPGGRSRKCSALLSVRLERTGWSGRSPCRLLPIWCRSTLMRCSWAGFWNVLENAAKYSPAGTPIEVAAVRTETTTEITIADSGRAFRRGSLSTCSSGLPVAGRKVTFSRLWPRSGDCRTIVEAHGGKITAARTVPKEDAVSAFVCPWATCRL